LAELGRQPQNSSLLICKTHELSPRDAAEPQQSFTVVAESKDVNAKNLGFAEMTVWVGKFTVARRTTNLSTGSTGK
jgi:hypothetical protein